VKKQRVSTTISQKHLELLKKYVEKYESQQKVLELALESLDSIESLKNSSKMNQALTWEERYWTCLKSTKAACFIQKDGLRILMGSADIELFHEHVTKHKPMEYNIEYFFRKPLKECSLKEVIDGLVFIAIMSNWFDTVDYTDNISFYMLIITHSLGLNNSILNKDMFESLFKTYGVTFESTISEKTIFMKVLKKQTQ